MLVHLLAALLAQAGEPQVAVVVTQRSGLTAERADALASKVSDVLSSGGVAVSSGPKASAAALTAGGGKNPTECQGKRPCISGLGRLLRVWGVVAVELADLDGTLAVHVELVDSDKAERHAELDVVMPAKKADTDLPVQAIPLIPKVRDALAAAKAAPAPAPVAKAAAPPPPAPEPEPVPAPAAAVAVAEEKPSGSPAPMIVALGGGVASAAASVVFLVLATQAKGELMRSGFDVTRAQAQATASRANTDYTLALGLGMGAGVLVLLGVVLGLTR